jgi:hypothetical protein
MTFTSGSGRIHPALTRVVNEHLEGLTFSKSAQVIVDRLLLSGSNAISAEEFVVAGSRTNELVAQLQGVLPEITSKLHRLSPDGRIDASTLNLVLSDHCPFLPFCGVDPSQGKATTDRGSGDLAKTPVETRGKVGA